jgi:hypothetical protein
VGLGRPAVHHAATEPATATLPQGLAARRERLQRVFEFLGLSLGDSGVDRRRIDELLDPALAKVNSAEVYFRVPGIEAIERKFCSERTGWLFSPNIAPVSRMIVQAMERVRFCRRQRSTGGMPWHVEDRCGWAL